MIQPSVELGVNEDTAKHYTYPLIRRFLVIMGSGCKAHTVPPL